MYTDTHSFVLSDGTATITGYITTLHLENATASEPEEVFPQDVVVSSASGMTGYSWRISIDQSYTYLGKGNFLPVTGRSNVWTNNLVTGTSSTTQHIYPGWLDFISAAGRESYRTGKFNVYCELRKNSPDSQVGISVVECVVVRPGAGNNNGGNNGGNSGRGGNSDDPEEQKGFWADLFSYLFVPDEECVDGLKDAASAFTNWGPIGFATMLNSELSGDLPDDGTAVWTTNGAFVHGSAVSYSIDTRGPGTDESGRTFDYISGTIRVLLILVIWSLGIFYLVKVATRWVS